MLNEMILEIVNNKIKNGEIEGVKTWYDLIKKSGLHSNIKTNLARNQLTIANLQKLIDFCEIRVEVK